MKNKIAFFAVVLMAVSPVLASGVAKTDDFSSTNTDWYPVQGTFTVAGGIANISGTNLRII